MSVETDLKIIERISKEKEIENWEFRAFLKQLDIEEEDLDSTVHQIYNDVLLKIDCTKCANCCKQVRPILDEKDISRFAFGFKMKIQEFKDKYITKDKDEPEGYIFNKMPCPFLKDNLCVNYKHRPVDCSSYPHLHKEEFLSRTWSVIENCSVCPIVFNLYERLKIELWHSDYDDNEEYDIDDSTP